MSRVGLLVEALRSGKYKQGVSVLCYDGKHCIWGVGFEVAAANGLEVNIERYGEITLYDNYWSSYSERLLRWYDIDVKLANSLMSMNDRGVPFPALANELERLCTKRE